MATSYNTYFIHCLSSVHVGDGSSSGTIDLPIQREKVTGFPVFRDSSLRGALREYFEKNIKITTYPQNNNEDEKPESGKKKGESVDKIFNATFGSWNSGDKNSALEVFPARLLFFPVRSFNGLFAYVTCSFVLKRFIKDMQKFQQGISGLDPKNIPEVDEAHISAAEKLEIKKTNKDTNSIGLEEFLFENIKDDKGLDTILGWFSNKTEIDRIRTHGAIVNDTVFSYMVKLFTEKVTRNRIDLETGVAKDTGLFNEEFLPEETVLYTALGFGNEFSIATEEKRKTALDIQAYVQENMPEILTIGGSQSIGKGMIGIKQLNTGNNGTEQ